ncbi:hypothetical protein E2L08_14430 [Palleronia sediminis]|uniref:Uncharacterized protein n=1 Tax=Palleronia sediminis TaxID=2547833 RepID=A0A4R6A5I1_9RHOB|nr:hypothetical protein [Palleronia sediminis]TDL76023.1 hypothetical protein E2L08_14430 [Palleronia sediminis]
MTDLSWQKKFLADVLGDDRGLPDWAARMVAKFSQEDIDGLHPKEREAALSAFGRVARQSRNARQGDIHSGGDNRPAWVEGDIDWGLRAARAALEAQPAGLRSDKANDILADCECPSAVGPNPGRDAHTPGTEHE